MQAPNQRMGPVAKTTAALKNMNAKNTCMATLTARARTHQMQSATQIAANR